MERYFGKRPENFLRGKKVFEFKTDKTIIEGFYELRHDDGNYPYQVLYTDLTKEPYDGRWCLEEANNACIWETAMSTMTFIGREIDNECVEAWRKIRSEDYAKEKSKGKRKRKAA